MVFLKVRLDPSLGKLHKRVERLMDEMMNINRPLLSSSGGSWVPEADLYEVENEVILLVNVAGVAKDDIEISYYQGYLRIRGKRSKNAPPGSRARYHRMEIGHGEFERILKIPVPIDENRVEAFIEDGLLNLTMKKRGRPQSYRVEIKS